MKKSGFISYCKFELKDNVITKKYDGEIYEVDDIIAIHSIKNKTVEFKIKAINNKDGTIKEFNEDELYILKIDYGNKEGYSVKQIYRGDKNGK